MAVLDLAQLTWEEVRDLDPAKAVALLPVGAVEAHGPPLPLATDVIIAETMARAAAARLATHGYDAVLLPPLTYTAAEFAAGLPGTVSVRPGTVTALLLDLARSLTRHGLHVLAVANAHPHPPQVAPGRTLGRQPTPGPTRACARSRFSERSSQRRCSRSFPGDAVRTGGRRDGRGPGDRDGGRPNAGRSRRGHRRGGPHPGRDRGAGNRAAHRRTAGVGRAGRRYGPCHRGSVRPRS